MRNFSATIAGILTVAIAFHLLRSVGAVFGVVPEVPLPYPMERNYSRYYSDIVESSDDTLFGLISLVSALAIGLWAGHAVHRRTFNPWSNLEERTTAKAWLMFLLFALPYSVAVQLVFGVDSDRNWFGNFAVDLIEYGVTAFVGLRVWKWWKVARLQIDHE